MSVSAASAASATSSDDGVWVPLRHPAFRAVWIASFVSNVGTWMQTVARSGCSSSSTPLPW